MPKTLRAIFVHPATSAVASAVALALAVALAVNLSAWQVQRAALEARIATLTRDADRSQSLLKAQLVACHATADRQRLTRAAYGRPRVLDGRPEGIDACARMESADQAVLSNLR